MPYNPTNLTFMQNTVWELVSREFFKIPRWGLYINNIKEPAYARQTGNKPATRT